MANPATTSDYLYEKQMEHLLRNEAFSSPYDSIYVALLTTVGTLPGLDQVEVSGGKGYERVKIATWTGPGATPNLEYSNTNAITFGAPTQNWGEVKGAALYDGGTIGARKSLISCYINNTKNNFC